MSDGNCSSASFFFDFRLPLVSGRSLMERSSDSEIAELMAVKSKHGGDFAPEWRPKVNLTVPASLSMAQRPAYIDPPL